MGLSFNPEINKAFIKQLKNSQIQNHQESVETATTNQSATARKKKQHSSVQNQLGIGAAWEISPEIYNCPQESS